MRRMLSFCLLLAALTPAMALETMEELRSCINGNVPQRSASQDLALVHTDRIGKQRQLLGHLLTRRNERGTLETTMRLLQPEDLRNAAYLLLEGSGQVADKLLGRADDRIWVYLPAAKRPRKINAGSAAAQMFGTNVSFLDFKHLLGSVSEGQIRRLEEARIDGRRTFPVAITPTSKTSPYGRVVTHIDARTCLALRTEFYTQSGALAKSLRLVPSKIDKVDGRFVGHEYHMEDANSSERTSLYLGNVIYDKSLPDSAFHPDGFYLNR